MEKRSIVFLPIVAHRDCGIKPAWFWLRCNAIFTCFCKCYLFLFPILRERTSVTVFPVRENFWNVYCFATNQMRDETAKDNVQTAAGISHDLIRNNELAVFLLQEIFNIPFGSLWKSYFLTTNQRQSLEGRDTRCDKSLRHVAATGCWNKSPRVICENHCRWDRILSLRSVAQIQTGSRTKKIANNGSRILKFIFPNHERT